MRILALLLVAACTSGSPAGATCKTNSDCESPLKCLDVAQYAGTNCTVIGHACSQTCVDDSGCASLGTNFHCFAGCGTAMFCGEGP